MDESEELEQDTGSLLPAIISILAVASAYAATNRAISNSLRSVDIAIGISEKLVGILGQLAQRAVTRQIGKARSKEEKLVLSLAAEKATEVAVQDAVTVVSLTMRAVIAKRQQVLRSGARTKVSAPGQTYADIIPGDTDDPKVVARRAAQAVRNSALQNLAEEAAKISTSDPGISSPYVYRKTWHSRKDSRVRYAHAFLGDKKYEYHTVDIGKPFITPDGEVIRFPGDPQAPIEQIAHCRCSLSLALHTA